jgi:hypothetical protein
LSNEKILKFIELPIKYKLRLKKYIGEIIWPM